MKSVIHVKFAVIKPSLPNTISMHVLLTVLFTFPKEPTTRICTTIMSFFNLL